MDTAKIAELFKASIDPERRAAAEATLSQMQRIIGFTPCLLQIIMADQFEMPVRQATAIYLKNMVSAFWDESCPTTSGRAHDAEGKPTAAPVLFTIHEQDRHFIRDHIIDAIARAPVEVIRVQLALCLQFIFKYDFPGRWPNAVDKILQHLQANDGQSWMGALTSLYRLVKNYEYKKPDERKPLIAAMKQLLPIVYAHQQRLMADESQESVLLQKLILKIFYALVQHSFSLDLMPKQQFANWMEIARRILVTPVPAHTLAVEDEEERASLVWWKRKKWAMHLLHRIFERYGSPGSVASEYKEFADYYLKNFVGPTIESVLSILEARKRAEFVAPRVLHGALMYLQQSVSHAFAWRFLKDNALAIIRDVIFPLMCFSARDEELWRDDPEEYVRERFDVFEELLAPEHAAEALLVGMMRRRDMLKKCAELIVHVLNSADASPQQKDGALHMIGSLSSQLLRRKLYRQELENMLSLHVLSQFASPYGFLRARACWCVREFSEASFRRETTLPQIIELVVNALLTDTELPVQIEAAIALSSLLNDQERAAKLVEPKVAPIVSELLKLLARTQSDDVTTVMQRFIEDFTDQVVPIAVEVAQGLAGVLQQMFQSRAEKASAGVLDDMDDADGTSLAMTTMGIMNTLESILNVMEDNVTVMTHLEEIVLQVIDCVLKTSATDFYEEIFSLIQSLTASRISPPMWQVFAVVVEMFKREGGPDAFVEMMPALHNYVTVDTPALLSVPARVEAVVWMCEEVMRQDEQLGEDAQMHAAKLLEVVLLQSAHAGGVIEMRVPIAAVVARMTRELKTSELRTMCLQVLIAALLIDPARFLATLSTFQPPPVDAGKAPSPMGVFDHFVRQWVDDSDCFLGVHDRKICLLGLSRLLLMRANDVERQLLVGSTALDELSDRIVPASVLLFGGLQKAYEARAAAEKKRLASETSTDEEEYEDGEVPDDEDEIDVEKDDYIERLELAAGADADDEEDEYDDEAEEGSLTEMEAYDTPLDTPERAHDEFVVFKRALEQLHTGDPPYYECLMKSVRPEQAEKLAGVFAFADQRAAASESKKIESTGGYRFDINQQLPNSFEFGGPGLS